MDSNWSPVWMSDREKSIDKIWFVWKSVIITDGKALPPFYGIRWYPQNPDDPKADYRTQAWQDDDELLHEHQYETDKEAAIAAEELNEISRIMDL